MKRFSNKKRDNFIDFKLILLMGILLIFLSFLFLRFNFTGDVVFDLTPPNTFGEKLNGNFVLESTDFNFYSEQAFLKVKLGEQVKELPLSIFIQENSTSLSNFPLIKFNLISYFSEESLEDLPFIEEQNESFSIENLTNQTSNDENITNEPLINENLSEDNIDEENQISSEQNSSSQNLEVQETLIIENESLEENPVPVTAPILSLTGGVVDKGYKEIFCQINNQTGFIYNKQTNEKIELISESVKVNNLPFSSELLIFNETASLVIITPNYSILTNYSTLDKIQNYSSNYVEIPLELFNLSAEQGELTLSIIDNEDENLIFSYYIDLNESLTSEEIIILNQTLLSNLTNQTLENLTIQTIQYQARIGQPVKWKKIVNKTSEKNAIIELPNEVFNITMEGIENSPPRSSSKHQELVKKQQIIPNQNKTSNSLKIEVPQELEFVEIEYYTQSPISIETSLINGKQIIVSGPDELNYKNIIAYTEIKEKLSLADKNKISLYWLTSELNQVDNSSQKISVNFTSFDEDEDGFIDYIEWIVPHLSDQTYELIIKIKDADHLDENKNLIENVYDYVKEKDNNWKTIPDSHYLRLKFENNLISSRDITIYAKSSNENSSRIEVYETNKTQVIASFENIINEKYYKIYLTNLTTSQDSFDLRIINSVDFDFVVDPIDSITINSPTNVTTNVGSSVFVNISITGSSIDSCLASLNEQANVTMLLNDEKTLANYTYTNIDSGYHNLTVYCNDSLNAFNSASSLNFFVNLPPNVTSVVLFPSSTDKNQNLTCNFTITDDNPSVIWGRGMNQLAGSTDQSRAVFCDEQFCYMGTNGAGYLYKLNKTSGVHIWNTTEGYKNQWSPSYNFNNLFCDSDFCYAVNYQGYFLKLNKTSGVHIYNRTTGYTNIFSSINSNLYCDDDFCYGGDSSGYFLKINKTSGVHIYNRTIGYTNQLSTYSIRSLYCDDDFCYGGDNSGYFLKINKTSGVHIYNTTAGYINQLTTGGISSLDCDSDFCYGGDSSGYFLKINKTSGVHIYNRTTGYTNQLSTIVAINSLDCDSEFCYGGTQYGYFLKINHITGIHIYNTTSGYTNRLSDIFFSDISCDEDFCYGGDHGGYFLKIKKTGEPLTSNLTWYKNGVVNLTSNLDMIFNGTTKNTTLTSGNFTKGDNWTCSVTPYDTKSYGENKNSSSSSIVNTPSTINWLQINPPYYHSSDISAYGSFSDLDNDNSTIYFQWYLNGANVENDTLTNVQPNTLFTTYLNYSGKHSGDAVNLSAYAYDGTNNSNVYWLNKLVWNTSSLLSTNQIRSLDCDDDFCYAVDEGGYFLKFNKTSGVHVYNRTTGYTNKLSSSMIYSLYCDDDYCYAVDEGGRFLKLNKLSGIHTYNYTSGYNKVWSTSSITSLFCDSDFCYATDRDGYFLKLNKTSGVYIYNRTTGYTNQLSSVYIYDLFCDSDFCYATDDNGYFLKLNKTSGVHIYNRTTGYTNQLTLSYAYPYVLSCDDDFCYVGDSHGYFLKLNKTSGVHIYNRTTGYTNRPSGNIIYSLFCDSDFCYATDDNGYFLKINKTSGVHVYNTTTGYTNKLSSSYLRSLYCDDEFCYAGDRYGSLKKLLKQDNVAIKQGPEINFVNSSTTQSGLYPEMIVNVNLTTQYVTSLGNVTTYLYNESGLVNSYSWIASAPYYSYQFTNLNEGNYTLNASVVNSEGIIGWSETISNITLDNLPPNVTSVVLFPEITDKNQNLTCNFTITDDNPSVIWGDGMNNLSNFQIYSLYCDSDFCYATDNNGYFLKINKTSGIHIYNTTTGYTNRLSTTYLRGINCDSDFCYAGDNNGYFLKINKTSGVHIYNTTAGYTNKLSTTQISSLYCDEDFCYAGDFNGYFLKINKTSGVHIYNTTTGYTNQLSSSTINSLFCDSDFCYGGDDNGYFLKLNKTSGVHIYNRTTDYTNKLSSSYFRSLYCDDEFCYAGDYYGRFLKINKTSGVHIYNTTTGYKNQLSTSTIHSLYCDSDFCYAVDTDGYFSKINKTSGVHIYNRTTGYTNRVISSTSVYPVLYCDSDFCYVGGGVYFLKIKKTGEPLISNVTWYKNGIFNRTSQLDMIFNGTTKNTTLTSGNFTRGDNWTCSVTPYDTKSWGENKNSSSSSIVNTPSTINWLQINPPYYPSSDISAYSSFSDLDNDNATLYFQWYINGENVENDTLTNVQPNTLFTIYLNYSGKHSGDAVNLSAYAYDGTNNSNVYWLNKLVWNQSNPLRTGSSYTGIHSLSCDDNFCYGFNSGYGGELYFLKINKTSGEHIYNLTTGYKNYISYNGAPIYYSPDILCDDDFCYGISYGGYFLKLNKTSGTHVFNQTIGYENRLTSDANGITSLDCDEQFCYAGDWSGYFYKLNHITGEHIYNRTSGYENRLSTEQIYSIDCDSDFCYGLDNSGYFLKINKTSGIHVYNRTTGYTNRLGGQSYYIDCDSDFCYGGDLSGYFLKINKTSGVHIYNRTTGYTNQLSTSGLHSLNCDDEFCYAADGNGYFLKINKTSGVQVFNRTEGYTYYIGGDFYYYQMFCDEYFCYTGSTFYRKLLKQEQFILESSPSIDFVSPSYLSGTYGGNYILSNVSVSNAIVGNVTTYLYNDSGLVESYLWNAGYTDYYYNFSNLIEGTYYLNSTLIDEDGFSNSTSTQVIILDLTPPAIDFSSSNPLNYTVVNDYFLINVTITDPSLANVTLDWNGSISCFNSTSSNLSSLDNITYTFIYNQSLLAANTYYYQINASDAVCNTNSTQVRYIRGNSMPSFSLVTISPSPTNYNLLDPNENASISLNVSDIESNLDGVLIQWKNSSASSWNNLSMENLSTKNNLTSYFGTLTLPNYEANLTYRIWSNDTLGKSNYTSETNLSSFWDCTWTANDLGQFAGWSENKQIANLTLNNTGDEEFSQNNCTLSFHLAHNLTAGTIYFNNWINNRWQKYYDTVSVSAGTSLIIPINATFTSYANQESTNISISEIGEISNETSKNKPLILVSNQEGPYLYQEISEWPLEVNLTSNSFNLTAYIRNLMGSDIPVDNNTAYNVSFYWSLPLGLSLTSGNSSIFLENMTSLDPTYLSGQFGFSDLASFVPGTKTLSLYSYGYNLSGDLIKDVNNQSIFSNFVNVIFSCYNLSDGIYVEGCGSLDGDYVAPVIQSVSGSSGGGGGGGGDNSNVLEKQADYEFVRGKTQEIRILFENDYDSPLSNLEFSLKGNLSKYIQVIPSNINSLPAFAKKEIILKIVSPGFIPLGKQILFLYTTGKIGDKSYNEKREIILQINELSKEEALTLVNQTNSLIEEVISQNISLSQLDHFNNTIYSSFEGLDFNTLKESYNQFEKLVDSALTSKSLLEELDSLLELTSRKDINVPRTKRLVNLAKLSFERQEFEESFARLRDAQIAFALETSGTRPSLLYYIKYKPLEFVSLILILIFSLTFSIKLTQSLFLKNKIRKLNHEEKIIMDLIKDSQRKTFFEKKMDLEEYHQSIEYFEKRLSEIEQNLIDSQKKKEYLFKIHSKEASLNSEKELILDKIKEIQDRYLRKKSMDRKIYDILMESYNTRLTQLEEAIASIETKRLLKKEIKTIKKGGKNAKK